MTNVAFSFCLGRGQEAPASSTLRKAVLSPNRFMASKLRPPNEEKETKLRGWKCSSPATCVRGTPALEGLGGPSFW